MTERKVSRGSRLERSGRDRRQDAASSDVEASVNLDELRQLIALLRENGLAEFELERKGFRVRLRRDSDLVPSASPVPPTAHPLTVEKSDANNTRSATQATAATTAPSHPGAQAETAASEDQDLRIISSPIVGTFYRAASPNTEPFVKIGTTVAPDSVVCIIEAMKLMNEIQAETSGEVVKIYVENGQPVEYGQPLFGVKR